jgi:hypothetical protein
VVLLARVEVVRVVHIEPDTVDLADRKVRDMVAALPAVIGEIEAAVVPDNHPAGILRVDPHRPDVAEYSREEVGRTRTAPRLAAVLRFVQLVGHRVDDLVVVRIDPHLGEAVAVFIS